MSLFDGGNKSISFGERGDETWRNVWQGGIVLHVSGELPSMEYNNLTKQKTFKNGEPVTKRVLSLDTKAGKCPAPPLDEEDDLTRDWHIDKGSADARGIKAAEKKYGNIEIGSGVYVRWTTGEGKIGDPRVKEVMIDPPKPGAIFSDDGPGQAQPAAQVPAAQPSFPSQVPGGPAQQPAAQVPSTAPRFDPVTGQPIAPPVPAANPAPYGFNPQTGQPNPAPAAQPTAGFDPVTGQPLSGGVVNPYAQ